MPGMAKSPYEILGVAPTAKQDEVRKAYRKLAKALHPDLNPGDATAEARFKEVTQAHQILSDPERRGRYDRGEIDASGAEQPPPGYYRSHAGAGPGEHPYSSSRGYEDFADLGDVFSELFGRDAAAGGPGGRPRGGRFRGRGGDIAYRLEIDFLEAALGGRSRVTLADGRTLDVTIPAGARDGLTLRLAGHGMPGLGDGPPGDALIELAVRPHPLFRRDGDDIRVELPVSIDEAVLGGKITVATIHGPVAVSIPKGSSSGRVLRLKGKGLKTGDQLVTLRVVLPDHIDPELESFMTAWRRDHAYDPRAGLDAGPGQEGRNA